MPAKRPTRKRMFSWEASCGNWHWQGTYPADTDPDIIVTVAMLALRGFTRPADRLTKFPAKGKSGYLVGPKIDLLTPDKGTVRIDTASAIEFVEDFEKFTTDSLRKKNLIKKIAESGKDRQLDI
jgi:hypothetical protein